ncbi:hypothetical protein BJV82DRAFT_664064 [Fennellomyces sp. T-0311]|nr:hypothetical protein BJV82DRAFT_664064 [Fennellomyces sp. T-0311]
MRPAKRARRGSNAQATVLRQPNTRSIAQRNAVQSAEAGSSTQHNAMTPVGNVGLIQNDDDLFSLVDQALPPVLSRTNRNSGGIASAPIGEEDTAATASSRPATTAPPTIPSRRGTASQLTVPDNFNAHAVALTPRVTDLGPYKFNTDSPIWPQFEMGLFRTLVFVNAFPSFEEANEATTEIVRNIFGTEYTENRSVSTNLVLNVRMM